MQDVSKFYSLGSFHQSQEMFEITFNKKKFDSLSKQHQSILRIAAEAANSDNYWYALKRYSDEIGDLPAGFVSYFNTSKYRANLTFANSGFGTNNHASAES